VSDIEERLREAHPNSQQYAFGSKILLEAADEIREFRARVAEITTALQDAANIIQTDANTEQNYGSLCRIGSVLAKVNADKSGGGDE